MFNYIYIDESGDLGEHGSPYFIVVSVLTENPLELNRIIKKIRQRKLKKKLKELREIKANNSNRIIRESILNSICKTSCSIIALAVKKESIAKHLFDVKEKLYNYLCGILISKIPVSSKKVIIVIDKKHTNSLLRNDFNNYIRNSILALKNDIDIEISHLSSDCSNELQAVDFIAWSIHRKFNLKDDSYFKIIKNKIINSNNLEIWN